MLAKASLDTHQYTHVIGRGSCNFAMQCNNNNSYTN